MSYVRMSNDSDVYIFLSIYGHMECCGCRLLDGNENNVEYAKRATFKTYDATIRHLVKHEEAGHKVPDGSYRRLAKEWACFGNNVVQAAKKFWEVPKKKKVRADVIED